MQEMEFEIEQLRQAETETKGRLKRRVNGD
jgi:hypothetical protein